MGKYKFYFAVATVLFLLVACGEGLAPEKYQTVQTKSYIDGTIKYVGGIAKFPDSSHVFGIYIAGFKTVPKDSSILNEILSHNAYVNFNSLPYPADSSDFSLEIDDAPVTIEYLAVSMQTDSSIMSQKVIGIFTVTGDNTKPSPLIIEQGKTYNVEITVDFDNLPPQPF